MDMMYMHILGSICFTRFPRSVQRIISVVQTFPRSLFYPFSVPTHLGLPLPFFPIHLYNTKFYFPFLERSPPIVLD